MKVKISFQQMSHSEPLEQHTKQKLEKIERLLADEQDRDPLHAEFFLKASKTHPHNRAEFHLRTPHFSLDAHDEGADMYVAIDNVIDTMAKLLKKERERNREKYQKSEKEKAKFSSDKYKL